MERLNLTAEQQKQMESIRNKYQPQMTSLREQITVERDKMSTMLKNNDSQNNLRSQHQKISTMQEKMNNLRFESMLEAREILTPQQRQQFSENMDERRGNKERKQK
jgi:Spy/CpxP family protein refolding chaperone